MIKENIFAENGVLHKCAMDIDRVINALKYAEADRDTGYQPAALIQVCINQLKKNLSTINDELGNKWSENQK